MHPYLHPDPPAGDECDAYDEARELLASILPDSDPQFPATHPDDHLDHEGWYHDEDGIPTVP